MPRAIIIDTDPGVDDAVAILMALGSPDELELVAVTTVAGNVPLSLTTKNALKLLEWVGRLEVPVYAGAHEPLAGPLQTAEEVHGRTGMDGFDFPDPVAVPARGFAADRIAKIVMSRPAQSVTLCCIGPLTNIALALSKTPEIAARLQEIVIMGGARREGGNVTPAAEFNIFVDPEAADQVLRCGANITMIPLDCTHQALTSTDRLERLRALGTPLADGVVQLLLANRRHHERRCGTDGAPLHDPTTIAYLLRPGLFTGRRVHVAIERNGQATRGMTVIDWWNVTGKQPNVDVLSEIKAEEYFDLVIERLGRLG